MSLINKIFSFKIEAKLTKQKEVNNIEREHSEQLQSLLYELFTYPNEPGDRIINHITTGNFRTKRVQLALEKVFVEPAAFF